MPITFRLRVVSVTAKVSYRQPIVMAATRDGRVFQLAHAFKTIAAARAVADKARERGTIDQSLWAELLPIPGSPADAALEAAAQREALLADAYRKAA